MNSRPFSAWPAALGLLLGLFGAAPPASADTLESIVFDTATASVQQGLLEQGPNPGHPAPFVFRSGDPGMDHLYRSFTFHNNGPAREVLARLYWTGTDCGDLEIGVALYKTSFNPADPKENLLAHSWEGPFITHDGHHWNDYRHSPGYYRDLFQTYYLDSIHAYANVEAYDTVVVVLSSRRQPGQAALTCPKNPDTAQNFYLETTNLAKGSPGITVGDTSEYEYGPGAAQGGKLRFWVGLTAQSTLPVTVGWATQNGAGPNGAVAGVDYVAASGSVTFDPGQTTKVVEVQIIGDATQEPNRTVALVLSAPNPAGFSLIDGVAAGTIYDDDAPAACFITSPAPGDLPVGKVGHPYGPVDFVPLGKVGANDYGWTLLAGSAPPGTAFSTYSDLPNPPGDGQVHGRLQGTPTAPGTWEFTLRLTCPGLEQSFETVDVKYPILVEPETPPVIFTLADVSVLEGNSGKTNAQPLLHISPPLEADETLVVELIPSSATPSDSDYVTLPPGQGFLVNAGLTSIALPLQLNGDVKVEDDETFLVVLRTLGGTVVASAQVVIANDDAATVAEAVVPAVSPWGLGALAVSLAAVALFLLHRRVG